MEYADCPDTLHAHSIVLYICTQGYCHTAGCDTAAGLACIVFREEAMPLELETGPATALLKAGMTENNYWVPSSPWYMIAAAFTKLLH